MKTESTVIVTGASGFIGGQTLLSLKDRGYTVITVDRRPIADHLKSFADYSFTLDFASDEGLQLLNEFKPSTFIHCAGTSLVGPSIENPNVYYENNVIKTKKLLDYVLENQPKTRIIFSSSAATYGNPIMTPCQEIDPTEPISPYGRSKLMVEWLMNDYHKAYGLDYVAFRYFNACGADPQGRHGQEKAATHIIARVLEAARDGKSFICNGNDYDTPDGTCIRDYVHVDDISAAHALAMSTSVPAGIYNLGTATGASNLEIVSWAQEAVGKEIPVEFGARREGDPAILTADPGKFNLVSGWKPKYSLHDMITHAWKWYVR